MMWLQRPPKVPKEANKSHEVGGYCDINNIVFETSLSRKLKDSEI